MLPTALLLLATATAAPPEVAHGKDFGIGFQLGSPVTFTGKYWFDEKGGLAFHVGTWFVTFYEGRVQYERQFVQFGDWDFGDVGMYWHAGLASRYWTVPGVAHEFSLGPSGGVAGEVRFKPVPAAAFLEIGTAIYALGHDYSWWSYSYAAGGRWYF
jgi:hypothetical protein